MTSWRIPVKNERITAMFEQLHCNEFPAKNKSFKYQAPIQRVFIIILSASIQYGRMNTKKGVIFYFFLKKTTKIYRVNLLRYSINGLDFNWEVFLAFPIYFSFLPSAILV